MTNIPKWNDEREAALSAFVGDEVPVSQETVAGAAESLETSTRSISSKLRKMGFSVELASARASRKFTDSQAETLRAFVEDNEGEYTYVQIAKNFENGAFNPKQIQGKILSMELTEFVKAAPKPVTVRKYTPEEEAIFLNLAARPGIHLEDIAEALDKPLNSVRGKALSFVRLGEIDSIPRQAVTKGSTRVDALAELGDVSALTVDQIAEAIEKTPRGVRVMLTRRGLVASDYDGAARAAKNAAAASCDAKAA